MKYIEITVGAGHTDTILAIAEKVGSYDTWFDAPSEDDAQCVRLLVANHKVQDTLDSLQKILATDERARIIVLPVETTLPALPENERVQEGIATSSRETLYAEMEKNSHLDVNFFLLVILSTLAAAIGLIEDNVAVVIGAMVIAPLLGPNLALGLGTALGDTRLLSRSVLTLFLGTLTSIFLSFIIGYWWPLETISHELIIRTKVGLDSVALALVSGAAAALSITTGLSTVLVGVMVAVALLPPAATVGIMLGYQEYYLAFGAGLQLAVNIVSVNLATNLVFFLRGIRPRTWWSKEVAKRHTIVYALVWLFTLGALVAVLFLRRKVNG